jgi:hypothetical protein
VLGSVFQDLADGSLQKRKVGTARVAQHVGQIILWAVWGVGADRSPRLRGGADGASGRDGTFRSAGKPVFQPKLESVSLGRRIQLPSE